MVTTVYATNSKRKRSLRPLESPRNHSQPHFLLPPLRVAFGFLGATAPAGPGSAPARFTACFAFVWPSCESTRQVAKGHANAVTKECDNLRVRLLELIASFEARSWSFASAKRFFREASASIAASCYDRLRQREGRNKYRLKHDCTPLPSTARYNCHTLNSSVTTRCDRGHNIPPRWRCVTRHDLNMPWPPLHLLSHASQQQSDLLGYERTQGLTCLGEGSFQLGQHGFFAVRSACN